MNKEIWKPIKGYENSYEISSLGNVKSLKNNKETILKPHKTKKGYYTILLSTNSKQKKFFVHRLVALAFLGDIKNKEVDHLNTIRIDNRVENLKIVTAKENSNNPLSLMHRGEASKDRNIKGVKCILNDGTEIKFKSMTEAFEKGYATCISGISCCCNGRYYKHNDKLWEFL